MLCRNVGLSQTATELCLILWAPMMKVVCTSEMTVYYNETTQRNIPEGSNLHTCCCENSKAHTVNHYGEALISLMMEAVHAFEMFTYYETT
jgi:hypothetical protein